MNRTISSTQDGRVPFPRNVETQACQSENSVRELQVPAAMSRLNHNVEQLHVCVSQLEERLTPILRVEPTNCEKGCEAIASPTCRMLHEQIRDRSQDVDAIANRVANLLRLLEL